MSGTIRVMPLILGLAGCASTPTLEQHAAVADPVLALETSWGQALRDRDTVALRHLLDTTFILTTSAPQVISRETYMEEAGRPDRSIEMLDLRDRRVRHYGGAAVTTGEATIVGANSAGPFGLVVRYTNVFIRERRSWRAVSSQTTIEDYDPTGGVPAAAVTAKDPATEARDSACANPVSSATRPAWRGCVRYGGGPSVGAPPSDYTGERPPTRWCLNATGRAPGDFGVTRMSWTEASRSWLLEVLSDTTDLGDGWRAVLGGAPQLTEADSIIQVMDEASCHAIAEILNRDLLGWEVGPPPVVVFGVRDYLIAFPSNARLGEFGMAAGMGLDRRIRGVASW